MLLAGHWWGIVLLDIGGALASKKQAYIRIIWNTKTPTSY